MVLGAALLLAAPGATGHALGARQRYLGAEIVVMLGDARRLAARDTPAPQRRGLRARIGGALAMLALLIRRARERNPHLAPVPRPLIDDLRARYRNADPGTLIEPLRTLAERYPFDPAGLLPNAVSAVRLRRARTVHRRLCAACHEHPALDVARPAFDLFRQAQQMPGREFAARLLTGIRGDAMTSLENPFSDAELAAFGALYHGAR